MAIRDKILITLFGCAASCLAAAGEATYDPKDLPSKDTYFWFASMHRTCNKGAPPSVRLSAYKQQVLQYYKAQLATASSAKQAGYRESIRQIENDDVPQADQDKVKAKVGKMDSASLKMVCMNMDAVTNSQIAISNMAMAQQRNDPKAVEAATQSVVAAGRANAKIIEGQWPEIAAAISAKPVTKVAPKPTQATPTAPTPPSMDLMDLTAVFAKNKALAEQGNVKVQANVGAAYAHGVGVPVDQVQATYWFRRAAEQGNAEAQERLANQYQHGLGVEQDINLATAWYLKAAAQGNTAAEFNLGQLVGKSTQDLKSAQGWYLKAAQKGHPQAQYFMGLVSMILSGDDPTLDETAYFWLLIANRQDTTKGTDMIGQLEERLSKDRIDSVRQAVAQCAPVK